MIGAGVQILPQPTLSMIIECEEIAFLVVCNSCATEAKYAGNNGIIAQNGRNYSQNMYYVDILHLLEALDGFRRTVDQVVALTECFAILTGCFAMGSDPHVPPPQTSRDRGLFLWIKL